MKLPVIAGANEYNANSSKDFDMTLKNEWVSKNYLSTNALGLREKEK